MKKDPVKIMKEEVKAASAELSPLTRANLKIAGAMVNASNLTQRGWIDMTGTRDGKDVVRRGSCWLEYVEKKGHIEYHFTLSTSETMLEFNGNGETVEVENAALQCELAHEGKVPRMVWARRLSVYALDEKAVTFKKFEGKIPAALLRKVERQLVSAIVKKPLMLLDDLAFQLRGYGPFADWCIESQTDLRLLCLDSVLDEDVKRERGEETNYRLLMPFVRAMLTDEDPAGRQFLLKVVNPCCLAFIITPAAKCDFPEVATAVMALFHEAPKLEIKRAEEKWGYSAWHSMTKLCLMMKMPQCATLAVRNLVEQYNRISDKDKDKRDLLLEFLLLFYQLRDFLKTEPKDYSSCDALLRAFESMGDPLNACLETKLLLRLGRYYTTEKSGAETEEAEDCLCEVIKQGFKAFDEKHKEDFEHHPWMKQLPFGVKNPLGWQSYLCCIFGKVMKAIATWPKPVLSVFDDRDTYPTQHLINGVPEYEIWRGFLPKDADAESMEQFLGKNTAGLIENEKKQNIRKLEWGGFQPPMETLTLREPKAKNRSELMSVEIVAATRMIDKPFPIIRFPYLAKASAEPNCVVKIWKYHPWGHYQAADAEFTLGDGRRLCAVMPYFQWDRDYIVRGAPWKAKLAGFAHEIHKCKKPEVPQPYKVTSGYLAEKNGGPIDVVYSEEMFDYFVQDNFNKMMSPSGFEVQGRVHAIRKIKALGQDVLVVTVETAGLRSNELNNKIDIYVGTHNCTGDELQIGDTIESWGWLYVDVFSPAVTAEEFFAEVEKHGFPEDPLADGPAFGYSGAALFVKDDKELKKYLVDYGKGALLGSKSVERVITLDDNPQNVQFLVRMTDGRILKYNVSIGDVEGKPEWQVAGAEHLVVHTEKFANGFKLDWFGVPK